MIERLYVPAAIILGSLVVTGALILVRPPDTKAATTPAAVSEYGLSLARIRENTELGTDLPTFTSLTVEAGARYWAARKFLPTGTNSKCGDGLNVARKSIGIWKDIVKDGIDLSLEARLLEIGVPVEHDLFKKIATSHQANFMRRLEAEAYRKYDVIHNMDAAENELRRSFVGDTLSAVDRAVTAELKSCAALVPSADT
ncbi:MAG: hypothetical protein ABSD21_11240 [Rhizomicrobium sp.]